MEYRENRISGRTRAWLFWPAALLAIWLLGHANGAVAQVQQIPYKMTSMTSTADRMISYRQQEHSWQTSDGAIHLMVNRGDVATGDSLVLYSSFDAGATWNQMFTLAGTDQFSTSDGLLSNGSTLMLVYAAAQTSGAINYASASYNPQTKSWALAPTQVAFPPGTYSASNPAIALDSAGNLWCGFTAYNVKRKTYNVQMVYRTAQGTTWSNTGVVFGTTNLSSQHSARPVRFNGGVGMVLQSDDSMYWAYRLNGWALNTPWVTSTIFTGLPPLREDPYDSHFSVVADASANLYMAFIADQTLYYMGYNSATQVWDTPRTIGTSSAHAAYPQVTLSGNTLLVLANYLKNVVVLQSTDFGKTFTQTQQLVHPQSATLDSSNPRVETPSYALNPVPTFQQFVNGTTQGLMYFAVPVTPSAPAGN